MYLLLYSRYLVLTSLVSILFMSQACTQAPKVMKDLPPEAFSTSLAEKKDAILVDVRTPAEWEEGYIKGALLMNFRDQGFKSQLKDLDKTKPVFVYCMGGGRSGRTANILHEMGFSEVYNLEGGLTAWKEVIGETDLQKPE